MAISCVSRTPMGQIPRPTKSIQSLSTISASTKKVRKAFHRCFRGRCDCRNGCLKTPTMAHRLSFSECRPCSIGLAMGDNSTPRRWFLDAMSDDTTSDADSSLEFDDGTCITVNKLGSGDCCTMTIGANLSPDYSRIIEPALLEAPLPAATTTMKPILALPEDPIIVGPGLVVRESQAHSPRKRGRSPDIFDVPPKAVKRHRQEDPHMDADASEACFAPVSGLSPRSFNVPPKDEGCHEAHSAKATRVEKNARAGQDNLSKKNALQEAIEEAMATNLLDSPPNAHCATIDESEGGHDGDDDFFVVGSCQKTSTYNPSDNTTAKARAARRALAVLAGIVCLGSTGDLATGTRETHTKCVVTGAAL